MGRACSAKASIAFGVRTADRNHEIAARLILWCGSSTRPSRSPATASDTDDTPSQLQGRVTVRVSRSPVYPQAPRARPLQPHRLRLPPGSLLLRAVPVPALPCRLPATSLPLSCVGLTGGTVERLVFLGAHPVCFIFMSRLSAACICVSRPRVLRRSTYPRHTPATLHTHTVSRGVTCQSVSQRAPGRPCARRYSSTSGAPSGSAGLSST